MDRTEIMAKINEVFTAIFDDSDIVVLETTTANDIEDWDSLAHLELISEIEKVFDVHFTLGEITNFTNVGAMCDSIVKHMG
ncbi:MAG: acyl carrier protein [Hydrogenoanaerobacterium sp.]